MFVSKLFTIFAADSDSPQGLEGPILVEKDVYERYLRRADLANQSSEDTQPKRSLWVYCALTAFMWPASIYHDVGYLELLILSKAMREPARGISEK